ncbi:MAG: ribbon-helix-helix domain-containing protein [Candidatus Thorarchaeota archaeon]
MSTIPIKFKEEDLKKIDALIAAGKYANRSQAIRSMVEEKLTEIDPPTLFSWEQEEKLNEIVNRLLVKGIEPQFIGRKTAVEIVREGRTVLD